MSRGEANPNTFVRYRSVHRGTVRSLDSRERVSPSEIIEKPSVARRGHVPCTGAEAALSHESPTASAAARDIPDHNRAGTSRARAGLVLLTERTRGPSLHVSANGS